MAASRIGSLIMIAARSLSSKPTQPAISATERPQPTHRPETGSSTQMRLHGVSTSALIVFIEPRPEVASTISGPSKSRQCAAKFINVFRKTPFLSGLGGLSNDEGVLAPGRSRDLLFGPAHCGPASQNRCKTRRNSLRAGFDDPRNCVGVRRSFILRMRPLRSFKWAKEVDRGRDRLARLMQ